MTRRFFFLLGAATLAGATVAAACSETSGIQVTVGTHDDADASVLVHDRIQIRIGENIDAAQGSITGLETSGTADNSNTSVQLSVD